MPVNAATKAAMEACIQRLDLGKQLDDARKLYAPSRTEIEDKILQRYRTAARELLQSLSFEGMGTREQEVEHPIESTCRWIYDDPTYKAWERTGSSILWVKGNYSSSYSLGQG